MPLGLVIALTLGFAAFTLTIGRWLVNRMLPWVQAHTAWPGGVIGFAIVLTLFAAAFTEWIGVHGILGAFLFGVALGDSPHLRERTRGTIDHFVSFIFAPLFFATIALRVDFIANFDLFLVVIVFVIAVVGKVLGCAAMARVSGFTKPESWAIGFGMNARGAMEIILGLLALQAGIIGEPLFVALVIMAIGTSIMSGATIQAVLGHRTPLRFTDYASAKVFIPRASPTGRREIISDLCARLAEVHGLDGAKIEEAVWHREQILSSGVGGGIAIPHTRVEGLSAPLVAVATLKGPIDFDARDGVPARVVVLILTPPEQAKIHLDLLSSVVGTLGQGNRTERAAAAENWTQFLAVTRSDPD
jgi:mannitol/fructose-specific phosphotransferase system IIA component (Ntr-type)